MTASTLGGLIRGSGLGLSLVLQLFLAWQLSAPDYGTVAVGLSLSTICSILATLGLDTAGSRDVARSGSEPGFAAQWWRQAQGHLLRRVGIPLVAYVLVALVLTRLADAVDFWALAIFGLTVPGLALLRLLEGVARGSRLTVHASAWTTMVLPLTWGSLLALTSIALPDLSPGLVGGLRLLAVAGIALVAQLLVSRSLGAASPRSASDDEPLIRTPTGLLALAVLSTGSAQIDTLIASATLGPEHAGSYALAARLTGGVAVILFGVNLVAAPALAAAHSDGTIFEAANQVRQLLRRAVPAAAMLAGITGAAIATIFPRLGADYTSPPAMLAFLLVAQVLSVAYGPVGTALTMTFDEWSAVRALCAALGIQCVLSVVAAGLWGPSGVALGTLAGVASWNGMMQRRVQARLGVRLRYGG
ncbi:oligosaccharide flippase family protein [Acidimicrobiia bacterium EGI L10123]|uniref:lipopolysaccharide biosynthesis protein n=1 Tax=Salinilacustrithrix flava TaxID=2957203 RepID=UPI003D7C346E|nr:oligosaccharide flippase family protein [Acidimicrobiia bacterium EGI L10123]